METIANAIQGEINRVSQTFGGRIQELAERYAEPLPQIEVNVAELSARVEDHLKNMGATWK
jgi:type I restriction enzyme M protein